MDLPNLLNKLKANSHEPKKFVAIEIGFDTVKVALWQSTGSHTEVISVGSTQSWSNTDGEDLLSAIDTSLADAQGSTIEEPDQVIFGLPETWVVQDGITDAQKPLLKSICQKFNFHPIGFVVTTEAIAHHLRDVEGGPPSAILIQIYSNQIAVSLIYLGQLESTQVIERSTNLTADIEEGLGRIPHTGHLPSRIIFLTNQDDTESVKQDLVSYDWQKKLSFLHLPKVESLPKDWSIKAVAIAGGAEVIAAIGFDNVSQKDQTPKSEPVKLNPVPPSSSPSDLGFTPVNLDTNSPPPPPAIETPNTPIEPLISEIDNLETMPETSPELAPPKKSLLIGFNQGMNKFMGKVKLPKFKFFRFSSKVVLPLIILFVLIGLGVAGLLAYRTFPEANIDVYVEMKSYQQQINFIIDPNLAQSNFETNILAGRKTTQELSGSKTIPTTGTRLIGDRAKGKVIVYNRTTAPKTFKAGTLIKAKNLQFTLDSAITIASASSKENPDFSLTIEPSKTESLVTAADIGDQYNLPKDTQFTVDNFATDTFFAVADQAFTGGSASSVAAVSTDDITLLKTQLIRELQDQLATPSATDTVNQLSQVSIGQPEISLEEYSADKNEEATDLTLNLSLSQLVYQYNPSDLSVIAQQSALKSLPENSQIKPDSTTINILTTTVDEKGLANITAQVILYHIPRIDADEYSKDLVGISLNDLPSRLSLIPGYQSHDLAPKYLIFKHLPLNQKQISLHIKTIIKEELSP